MRDSRSRSERLDRHDRQGDWNYTTNSARNSKRDTPQALRWVTDASKLVPVVKGTQLLPGLSVGEPHRFVDERGFFVETYNKQRFADETGFGGEFVQDNLSRSVRGVVRGLHYQVEPRAQGKLVSVVVGAVFDVAVDIRESSSTFGQWFGVELSAQEGAQLWIPRGFAHGYLALTNGAEVLYKTTEPYSPTHERAIRWDDPTIAIAWPIEAVGKVLVSERDAEAPSFSEAEMFA